VVKKKIEVAKKAGQNREDAHAFDKRDKSLPRSIRYTHQDAKQFHAKATGTKRKTETIEIEMEDTPMNGLTEKDLQRSANEQMAQVALVGTRGTHSNAFSKRKRA
jgi:hypothetical protein